MNANCGSPPAAPRTGSDGQQGGSSGRKRFWSPTGKTLAVVGLLLSCLAFFFWGVFPHETGASGPAQAEQLESEEPSAEVVQAIRDVLSSHPARERRGESLLKRMGLPVVPQLRYWVRRARFGAERVELLIQDIVEKELGSLDASAAKREPLLSRDLSAADFFQRKLLEARERQKVGDYETARRIAEAVLLLDKDSPLAYELRRVARQSRERMVVRELEPRIEIRSLVYEVGEKPEVAFRLINRSRRPALVELERGVLGTMNVLVTRQFVDGNWKQDRQVANLLVSENVRTIALEPGESWAHPIPFHLGSDLPLAGVVVRVQFAATFRPKRWELKGEKDSNIPVKAAPAELWIVPPGHKKTIESPEKRLVTALFFGRHELLLVAGWISVWAGEDDPYVNEKLVALLIKNLDALDSHGQRLAQRFLAAATGKGYEQPKQWKKWWATIRRDKEKPESPKNKPESESARIGNEALPPGHH